MRICDKEAFVMETLPVIIQTSYDGIHSNGDNKIFENNGQEMFDA